MLSLDSLTTVEMAYNQTSAYMQMIDPFITSDAFKADDVSKEIKENAIKENAIELKGFIDKALKSLEM